MFTGISTSAKSMRLKPLAACLAPMLGLAGTALANGEAVRTSSLLSVAPAQLASAPVTSCGDDVGDFTTLRHAVLVANSDDTIDLSGLACSRITLVGAIDVIVPNLTIIGAGADKLTIDGNHVDRVFKHTGMGTLSLTDISIANGTFSAPKAYGGCLYSNGKLTLTRATVTSCKALGQTIAVGGGAFALKSITFDSSGLTGNDAYASALGLAQFGALGGGATAVGTAPGEGLTIMHSLVSGNTAHAASGFAEGGGVVGSSATVKYSTLSGNHAIALGDPNNDSAGGAIAVQGSLSMFATTIDHNDADIAGAIFLPTTATSASIAQSTISGNTANLGAGGVYSGVSLDMANSTIAFNSAPAFGGLVVAGVGATLNSNIIADNTPNDLDGTATFSGGSNLIKVHGALVVVPFGTIPLDPDLGPLAYNGGVTRTHALNLGSPAIDQGNNVVSLTSDQRGGSYARVVDNNPDIGAFEFDPDHIFADRFGAP